MKVYFVGAGPGDPDLLTVKAGRMLRECRICIYAGSLVSPGVLALLPPEAETHDSATLNLDEISALFRDARKRDIDVVRLHSGDPSIYGAIGEQMQELDRLGVDYEVVPGVSSFQAAAAALRCELTAPEISQTITLTRTSGRTPLPEEQELDALAKTRATLCIFLSAHKTKAAAETLARHYGGDCPAAVVYRASWPDQQIIRGTLADIAETVAAAGIKKTAMIIVGRALSGAAPASKLYDPGFVHGYRTGAESGAEPQGPDCDPAEASIGGPAIPRPDHGGGQGRLFVVGVGPGGPLDRTRRAEEAIAASRTVVGYKRYLDLIQDITAGKEIVSSGMMREKERCLAAIKLAEQGQTVAIVSSGDAGIYGMAGLVMELAAARGRRFAIEVAPGVTAASATAARLGAPLMLDFACVSLSDLLVPWEAIRIRLEAVASADLVAALYNPRSKKRTMQLEEAAEIFRKYREGSTPVGIGSAVGAEEEELILTDLAGFLECDITMRSVILIGNRSSRITDGFFVTPRGYHL
jgi:precorrin-4/cobalt-precorrin-4 C11-methyltransferase